jgi:hypothetical protein
MGFRSRLITHIIRRFNTNPTLVAVRRDANDAKRDDAAKHRGARTARRSAVNRLVVAADGAEGNRRR